jgi:DNA-binding response OmpR family regulator
LIPLVLVISHNTSCRRLYVDNLVRRGYIAVGVTSGTEAENVFRTATPALVLVCCMPTDYQKEVERLRTVNGTAYPIVLISQDKPDPAWVRLWHADVCPADPMDLRRIVDILQPWLPAPSGQPMPVHPDRN